MIANTAGISMSNNYKDKVWEQYSELPYPPRNPDDEKNRLIRADLANLLLVNHVFWRGQKKFTKSFRVLDAGCGTGDSTIYLAEQLKNTKAEIVALDMSKQSLSIAKQRAKVRNLNNIQFLEESLLNSDNENNKLNNTKTILNSLRPVHWFSLIIKVT